MSRKSDQLEDSSRPLWLIDGYNVLRVSLPSGHEAGDDPAWWTGDRRRLLLELAARLPEPLAEVWVVFDGKHLTESRTQQVPATQEGPLSQRTGPVSVGCVFAPSADEWILRALKTHEARRLSEDARSGPALRTFVVTADRPLASRCRQLGAEIVTTGSFIERCERDRRGSVT